MVISEFRYFPANSGAFLYAAMRYCSDRSSVIYGQIYGQNVCLLSVVSLYYKNVCNAAG